MESKRGNCANQFAEMLVAVHWIEWIISGFPDALHRQEAGGRTP
jgi:hypothetical protein